MNFVGCNPVWNDLVRHIAAQYGFELTPTGADLLLVTETAWPLDSLDETVEDLHAFFSKVAR